MIVDQIITAADDVTLSVTQWGAIPSSIVLIHGFGDGKYLWSPFSTALVNYAGVLAMDLRGHGDSQWDSEGAYFIGKFVSDAQTIVDACCSDDLLLVGHSLGAEIAILLAASNRQRVKGLVLVDGGVGLRTNAYDYTRRSFASRMHPFVNRSQYRRLLDETMPLADGEMLDLTAQNALTKSGGVYCLKCDPRLADVEIGNDSDELWSVLESLNCRCLLIRGEASAFVSRHLAAEMVLRVAGLRCQTVSAAGHAVMTDNPKGFLITLQRFASDIYGSRGTLEASNTNRQKA